ncbi:hypothetical protein HDU97_004806 [Phlyctochytrium planicorne]|nr:hypothetical protein HDU97_004806 [Phlyctochytrium planicorne]
MDADYRTPSLSSSKTPSSRGTSPEPSPCEGEAATLSSSNHTLRKRNSVTFREVVIVGYTHPKNDYDRTSTTVDPLTALDIQDLIEMRSEMRKTTEDLCRAKESSPTAPSLPSTITQAPPSSASQQAVTGDASYLSPQFHLSQGLDPMRMSPLPTTENQLYATGMGGARARAGDIAKMWPSKDVSLVSAGSRAFGAMDVEFSNDGLYNNISSIWSPPTTCPQKRSQESWALDEEEARCRFFQALGYGYNNPAISNPWGTNQCLPVAKPSQEHLITSKISRQNSATLNKNGNFVLSPYSQNFTPSSQSMHHGVVDPGFYAQRQLDQQQQQQQHHHQYQHQQQQHLHTEMYDTLSARSAENFARYGNGMQHPNDVNAASLRGHYPHLNQKHGFVARGGQQTLVPNSMPYHNSMKSFNVSAGGAAAPGGDFGHANVYGHVNQYQPTWSQQQRHMPPTPVQNFGQRQHRGNGFGQQQQPTQVNRFHSQTGHIGTTSQPPFQYHQQQHGRYQHKNGVAPSFVGGPKTMQMNAQLRSVPA